MEPPAALRTVPALERVCSGSKGPSAAAVGLFRQQRAYTHSHSTRGWKLLLLFAVCFWICTMTPGLFFFFQHGLHLVLDL